MDRGRGPSSRRSLSSSASSLPPISLSARLTPRDRWLCRLLWDHRVLTTRQVAQAAFPSLDSAEDRLAKLTRLEVVDRFRPLGPPRARGGGGSQPYHYTLGPAGAEVVAAEDDTTARAMGYRRDRDRIAFSQHLGHLVGCNGFFTALLGYARRERGDLADWWSERRCAAAYGAAVRPDGYGRWREGTATVAFFLEHDNATEWVRRVAAKLDGYADLAAATGRWTPLLLWLPDRPREHAVRAALPPTDLPVATAARDHAATPAHAVWLPVARSGRRLRLAELADPAAWRPDRPRG